MTTGKNTMQMVSVAASAGTATWCAPSRIATVSGFPGEPVAVDVLDLDRRVVDQHADRQRQAAQRHQVQRLAGQEEADDRRPASAIGIEVQTMTTERQLPRKKRIISDTSAAAITASRSTLPIARAHEHRLIEVDLQVHALRARSP